MKRKPGEPVPFEMSSATRAGDGKPFVRVTIGSEQILLSPSESRTLGAMCFDFAALAENDAAAAQVIEASAGEELSPEDFVGKLTEARKVIRTLGQRVN